MEQVSDLPNVRFYTANEDIQAGGLATVGIDGIVRAATSPRTPLYRAGTPKKSKSSRNRKRDSTPELAVEPLSEGSI